MTKIRLTAGTQIKLYGPKELGLCWSGRKALIVQNQETVKRGTIYTSIIAELIDGPHKGLVRRFEHIRMSRYATPNNCRCDSYPFPHAPGRGNCKVKLNNAYK